MMTIIDLNSTYIPSGNVHINDDSDAEGNTES